MTQIDPKSMCKKCYRIKICLIIKGKAVCGSCRLKQLRKNK